MTRRRPRSTVATVKPPRAAARPSPPRVSHPPPPRTPKRAKAPARRQIARIATTSDASLLDVVDNLLRKGVVLNADVVLALANVDLVYVRLSAILVAADRLLRDRNAR